MRYVFDIDGTLCSMTYNGNYEQAAPFSDMIRTLNCLFDKGEYIILFTARGSSSGKNYRDLTEKQLKDWGVKYNELIMNKPHADYFIDDKGLKPEKFLDKFGCDFCFPHSYCKAGESDY